MVAAECAVYVADGRVVYYPKHRVGNNAGIVLAIAHFARRENYSE